MSSVRGISGPGRSEAPTLKPRRKNDGGGGSDALNPVFAQIAALAVQQAQMTQAAAPNQTDSPNDALAESGATGSISSVPSSSTGNGTSDTASHFDTRA